MLTRKEAAVREIGPGIHHWTAVHPKIRIAVSSYYVEPAATLVDPLEPPEGIEWFRGRAEPERIVLTSRHHYRHSDRLAEAFACPVLCNENGLHEFEGGPEVEGFSFGDALADGIRAVEVGVLCPEETALHVELADGYVALADSLTNYEQLGFVSDRLLGDDPEAVKSGLAKSFRRLLELDFDGLLLAHGEPIAPGGKEALSRFVE
jgi:hypothetical protein